MIGLTEIQRSVIDLVILHFKGDEITGTKLANAIGLKQRDSGKDGSDMRSVINRLRQKGYPICANSSGYYYPRDQNEIEEYIASLAHRIQKENEALEGMRTALEYWSVTPEIREPTHQMTIVI